MHVTRRLRLLTLLFPFGAPLVAQEEAVLPPSVVQPPAPVEIPPVPFQAPANPTDPHNVGEVKMPEGLDIEIKGEIKQLDAEFKKFAIAGPIHLKTNRGEEVFADRAELDLTEGTYTLLGDVSVFRGPVIQRGDRVIYNLKTKKLDTANLSIGYDPIILEAGNFEMAEDEAGNRVFTGYNAGITTHDVDDPNYWLRAGKTTFYPDERMVFEDLKVYIGDTPVFWLPYLSQPLNAELGYRPIPGARTNWGIFLLNTYGLMLGGDENTLLGSENPWLLSKWHLDLRSRRGAGFGLDLFDTRIEENSNYGWMKFYLTHDTDPTIGRSGIPRGPVDPSRYRMEFQYRIPLEWQDGHPDASYALNYDLHLLSDNHFLEDFDPQFYRSDAQPDNTIFLTRQDDGSVLTALARLRVNNFYRSDTRSPEIVYDQIRRPLWDSPILHEGSTSLGIYAEKMSDPVHDRILDPLLTLPDGDPELARLYPQLGRYEQLLMRDLRSLSPSDPRYDNLYRQLVNPEFQRFHTYQEMSSQLTMGDLLHLTPHVGAGYSRYFSAGEDFGNEDRTIFSTGLEASLKFKKDYPDYQSRAWGIDGMRHTLQPYANWSYVSTSNLGQDFPAIDRLTFSTRPVPINVGRFVAIDDIENWNLVRIGMRNRFTTKRDGSSLEWLFIDTYLDGYIDDPELDREFSNLYNDVTWQPLPWLAVEVQTQVPIISSGSGYNEFTTGVRFMPTPDFEFSVSQSNLNNHPYLLDSNRVHIKAYNRLNENWGVGMLQQWEFDDGTLELEQYTLHRNYDNWILSAGLTHRNNRIRDEYGFMVNFTLKDFPKVSVPFTIDAE